MYFVYLRVQEDIGEGVTFINNWPQSGLPAGAFMAMVIVICTVAGEDKKDDATPRGDILC